MEGHGVSLPDTLIPYCRDLYERFQAEIADDPQKRDAIIWIADLLRVKNTQALEVLQEREAQVIVSDAPLDAEKRAAESSVTVASTASSQEASKVEVMRPEPTSTVHHLPPPSPPHPEVVEPETPGQKAVESLQPSSTAVPGSRVAPSTSSTQTVNAKSTRHRPCVGDWKCRQCSRWNKLYHERCRTRDQDTYRDCDGTRSFPGDVECVQKDDGRARHNRMGKYKGDWYCGECEMWNLAKRNTCSACTTRISEAEFVMGNGDNLKDAPPPPPRSDETDADKRRAYFAVNGRFITPRKRKW